jgi:hypothetical protein
MSVLNTPRRRHRAGRVALPVAIAAALLTAAPGTANAGRPAVAAGVVAPAADTATPSGPAELRATRAALLAAVETCSTRVPNDDPDAVGRCARDLAIPDTTRQGPAAGLLETLFFCLRVRGAYPTISDCMYVHGH